MRRPPLSTDHVEAFSVSMMTVNQVDCICGKEFKRSVLTLPDNGCILFDFYEYTNRLVVVWIPRLFSFKQLEVLVTCVVCVKHDQMTDFLFFLNFDKQSGILPKLSLSKSYAFLHTLLGGRRAKALFYMLD